LIYLDITEYLNYVSGMKKTIRNIGYTKWGLAPSRLDNGLHHFSKSPGVAHRLRGFSFWLCLTVIHESLGFKKRDIIKRLATLYRRGKHGLNA